MTAFVRLGDRAVRFPRPATVSPRAVLRAVRAWPHVVDVVLGPKDIGVYFDDEVTAASATRDLASRIAALASLRDEGEEPRVVQLLVRYDGPDVDDVVRTLGITRDTLAEIHAGATYTVESIGFAPGFAYLVGLDRRLHLPRRETPRPRVPAGSVAIAGGYTSVYPFDSPGGWHLIGSVIDGPMFDEQGPRVQLGDRVRFSRADVVGGDA